MLTITDYVIILSFLFFAYRGAKKGILKTFFGPISLIAASIFSYIYYQKTGNLKYALGIAILGPFTLNIVLSIITSLFKKLSKEEKTIAPVSQFFGALLSISWSGTLLLLTIFLIPLIPLKYPLLLKTQSDISHSQTYLLIDKVLGNKMSESREGIQALTSALKDPEKIKALQSTQEFQELYQNERFKEILKDEELIKQLQKKNIQAIASNPKIMGILQDKEFLKQLMALNKAANQQGESLPKQ